VPDGTVIGDDDHADRERFLISEGGVVVVNRGMLGQEIGYQPTYAAER